MDTLTKKGTRDRGKINMLEDFEVKYWAREFGVSRRGYSKRSTRLETRPRQSERNWLRLIGEGSRRTRLRCQISILEISAGTMRPTAGMGSCCAGSSGPDLVRRFANVQYPTTSLHHSCGANWLAPRLL